MLRCTQCNASLAKTEKTCYGCGSAVAPEHPKTTIGARFQSLVNILFVGSVILTIASIFTDYVPGFLKCFGAMVILYFVKNSADQMTEAGKS